MSSEEKYANFSVVCVGIFHRLLRIVCHKCYFALLGFRILAPYLEQQARICNQFRDLGWERSWSAHLWHPG